ncbi:MAG TPA: Druantia anti-phage system protein DruA [Steroidobacteraceae bacterium]|nr:Druantia anti-phage system protein DruA [Steroidobacteraceae bacterium]
MTMYCGREFSPEDIQTIKLLMEHNPSLKRRPLSRKVCERLGWLKPNGELKDMTCRVAMLRMHCDAVITLPPAQSRGVRVKPHFPPTTATDPQTPLLQPVHELGALTLCPITDTASSRLWNEYIARYHYLGYTPMSGSQMRYNVFAGDRHVALLSFGASAWKLAGRERFIGWQEPERLKNLQLVVNNARFLILPWIQSKGLASKILSKIARQLPLDWHQRYGYSPVLFETFVESQRHRGTCYKAANWTHVGQTTGRGKKSTVHHQIIPVKDIWLYPLRNNFASLLLQ